MKNSLFLKAICYLLGSILVTLTGCNFSPGALLGDVNDDPWEWGSSNYSFSSSCWTREINHQSTDRGCTVPGPMSSRIAKASGFNNRLELDLRKERPDDDFEIVSLKFVRDSAFASPRYSIVTATCTEDKNEARTFSQRWVCTTPSDNAGSTDRFHSMSITNKKCGSYTTYDLPSSCSIYDSYSAKYGWDYFPTL